MHAQVRFIDKLQCSHRNTTNLQDSDSYSVRTSFFEQRYSIFNLNGGFSKDLWPKLNLWTLNHSILNISSKLGQFLSSTQMHTQVRFIDKFQCSHQNTTNLQDSDSYSVKTSFLEQCSSIFNLNGGFYKDLQPKQNFWTRNHLILKGFCQKRRN